ncbi:LysM peptidoglycan-binding domain-containing protein [Terrabacter sp. LjRoot27]|uniref:LysM peptidoglycan-binding domain-containing protein n=1 Tax=Terrabacter sp. LjRoot27 TaxID=3342306 RepID=UPI003ED049F7
MNRGTASATTGMHRAQATGRAGGGDAGHTVRDDRPRRPAAGRDRSVGREAAAGAAGLAVAVLTLLYLLTVARRGLGTAEAAARPDDVLLLLMVWVGVLLAAWLALGSLLAVASLLPGAAGRVAGEVAERVTPVAVRKVLTLVLGATVGSMALPAAPVSSAGSGPSARGAEGHASPAEQASAPDLAPGYAPTDLTPGYAPTAGSADPSGPSGQASGADLPDIPEVAVVGPGYSPTPRHTPQDLVAPAPPRLLDGPGYVPTPPVPVLDADRSRLLAPAPRLATSAHDLVTVRRGDSLWTIAARHLGPGTSDAQICREWPRWYAANRDVVGDDPDLLVPGQQLRPPSSTSHPATRGSRATTPHPSTTHVGAGSGAPAEQGAR